MKDLGEAFRNAVRQTADDLGSATGVKPLQGKSHHDSSKSKTAFTTSGSSSDSMMHDGDMEGGHHPTDIRSGGLRAVASAMGL